MATGDKRDKNELESLADKLTSKQLGVANFVALDGMSIENAIVAAGYSLGNKEEYRGTMISKLKKLFKENEVFNKYIDLVRRQAEKNLLVDEYFIISHLKELALHGESENSKLRALENLGKIKGLYVDKQEITTNQVDPSEVAKEAFKRRKEQFKIIEANNEKKDKLSNS